MINHIDGRLIEKTPTYAVIECAGVGYVLNISLHTYSKIGEYERCKLLAHLSIKEDAHTLFGFADEDERSLFRHLISVSGVGASTARMILSSLTPQETKQAIISGNVPLLKSIKGIGEKSAQRIIIDLKDKLGKETMGQAPSISFNQHNTVKDEALSAMVILGFARVAAEKAIDKILKTEPEDITVEKLIKLALKNI